MTEALSSNLDQWFPSQFANIFLTYQTFVTNLHRLRVELHCQEVARKIAPCDRAFIYSINHSFKFKEGGGGTFKRIMKENMHL